MRIHVIDPIHETAVALLKEKADAVLWNDPSVDDWSEADAVIVRAAKVTRDQLADAPKLKVIGKHGIGVNAIDVDAATEKGISVVYTPTGNVNSVAELAVGLMLHLARKLPQNMTALKEGDGKVGMPVLTGSELENKTLGLVGIGRISRRVAAILRGGFGMRVAGFDPYAPDQAFAEHGITRFADIGDLLGNADFVSISVPYTDQTKNLIGAPELARMKPTAILVNTSRGGIVNEKALYDALSRGVILAAGSDVFETEPPAPDNPLLSLPNFAGTLHVGGSTEECLARVGTIVASDVLAVLDGREPLYPYKKP